MLDLYIFFVSGCKYIPTFDAGEVEFILLEYSDTLAVYIQAHYLE